MEPRSATSNLPAIGPLDLDNPRELAEVAELHIRYFPRTTEARCGMRFLAGVYLPTLIRAGAVGCIVARRDGQVVSYSTYTHDPRGYFKKGVRAHPARFAAGFALAGLTRLDAALGIARHAWAAVRPRRAGSSSSPKIGPDCGELLYVATCPEHRSWTPPGAEARVSASVFRAVFDALRRAGCRRALLKVAKTNEPSLRLCHALGCRIDAAVSNVRYHFLWRELE